MAETSALNSHNKVEQRDVTVKLDVEESQIKAEVEVKPEPQECAVCAGRERDGCSLVQARTRRGASLLAFLCRFTRVDLASAHNCSRFVCSACLDLINVLEQAEIDYLKLKETFEAIISKNPLFEPTLLQPAAALKTEVHQNGGDVCNNFVDDSEDEPLAQTKKKRHRKVDKRKKKSAAMVGKRKLRNKNDSWECAECGITGESGGVIAEAAHKITAHTLDNDNMLTEVKTEDSADGSQSPTYNNGFDSCIKIEYEDNFDDNTCSLGDEDFSPTTSKKSKTSAGRRMKSGAVQKRKKKQKERHACEECGAQYASQARLAAHRGKHHASAPSPPHICDVCGAHYKHRRAYEVHIALHKGISDWKCEECNKLFPSKNALQRHNNIHTGKLNYQCDLCGKSFIHTSSFKMHKLSHSGLKPHACDVCGLALMTRSHLKRHQRVHSGEKRHECAICGKRFSERYNLVAHSKSHEAGEAPVVPAVRRRLFRCNFCPERFERRYMLERHCSVSHGRTLERPPATPRNTMSKLLKAQAQARRDSAPAAASAAPPASAPPADTDTKDERSPEPRTAGIIPQKLIAQLSSSTSIITSNSWSGVYAAEFGLRHDYSH